MGFSPGAVGERNVTRTRSRGWSRYSKATGLLVATAYAAFVRTAKLVDGGPAGLIERIGIACGMWIVLLAISLMRSPKIAAAATFRDPVRW